MADNLQEPNPLNNKGGSQRGSREADEIVRSAAKSPYDVKKLRKYTNELKKLLKLQKKESDQYKEIEKNIKKLESAEKNAVRSKGQLIRTAEALTSKLGSSGAAGAVTRFGRETVGATTSVNKLDGSMNILGRSTNISAGKFSAYAVVIQFAITVMAKLGDEIDKAQVKQANLQRTFGAGNISIRESFNALSQGWKVAGAAGAEAAPKLNAAIRAARGQGGGDLMSEMGGAKGSNFTQLLKVDVGSAIDMPSKIKELAEVFNIRTQGGINEQVVGLLNTIIESGLPMERYTEMISNLGGQFADVGITALESAQALGIFEDSTNKGFMTMGLQMKTARLAMDQQLTAGGFQGRVLTAAFAQDMWDDMDATTTAALDESAAKVYGKGTGFRDISAYDASNVLADLEATSPGEYTKAMEGTYHKLKQIHEVRGRGAAEMAGQAMGIPDWREFKTAWEAEDKGEMTYERLQEVLKTKEERFAASVDKFGESVELNKTASDLMNTTAELNQQWYSQFKSFWVDAIGRIVSALGGGEDVFEWVQDSALAMLTFGAGNLIRKSDWWQDITARYQEVGYYTPEAKEQRAGFKKEWGISAENLYEYQKKGGLREQGKPLEVYPGEVDEEIMKGKGLEVSVRIIDTPEAEEAGGTTHQVTRSE